ncbi:helix-turn-helix transcriptional regulator [Streptomyces cinnamoneus]|nr:LuxR C-terminal-related transcriptional regulator [Streptomyces cinnamoneus]
MAEGAALLGARDYERMLDLVVEVLGNDGTAGGGGTVGIGGGAPADARGVGGDAGAGTDTDHSWHLVTRHLLDALDCGSATFSEVNLAEGTGRIEGWAPDRLGRYVGGLVQRRIRQHHPLISYAQSGDLAPVDVGEICDGWRRTQWYSEARRDFGVTQQVGLPLTAGPGVVRLVIVGRDGRFGSRELAFAARVRPLLEAVGGHVRERRRLRAMTPALPAGRLTGHGLTPRELTVLGLLAEGLTAEAIGRRLAISPHTVNRHLEKVYRKLGTNNRVRTVLLARQAGLVP